MQGKASIYCYFTT